MHNSHTHKNKSNCQPDLVAVLPLHPHTTQPSTDKGAVKPMQALWKCFKSLESFKRASLMGHMAGLLASRTVQCWSAVSTTCAMSQHLKFCVVHRPGLWSSHGTGAEELIPQPCFLFGALGKEPGASCTLYKASTTELWPSARHWGFYAEFASEPLCFL